MLNEIKNKKILVMGLASRRGVRGALAGQARRECDSHGSARSENFEIFA